MAVFTGTASVNFIRPDFVSSVVTANPAGSRPSAADDVIDGRGGADTMDGGGGDDVYFVDQTNDTVAEVAAGAGGVDLVNAAASFTLSGTIENLTLTGSRDLDGTGNGLDNEIVGNRGDNVLRGLGGDDTLDGGRGADEMDGGRGDDTYHVDNAGDVAAETSAAASGGDDLVLARASHTLGFGIERLTFQGTGSFSGTGNDLQNTIRGNSGANTLGGGQGDDVLVGNDGNDILLGGLGDDTLRGRNGADTLQGGAETDILIGGFGSDVFDFNAASHSTGTARDTIRAGDGAAAFLGDRIDVSGMDADETQPGNQDFVFGGNGVGHLSLVDSGGITIVRGNTDNGGGFEFEVAIEDGIFAVPASYSAANFIL